MVSIGEDEYYSKNFTTTPITISSGTKKCIGYFTFDKTGLFLLRIRVRWTLTTKSTPHSILVNSDNSTVPEYKLSVYGDSNSQLAPDVSFIQYYILAFKITSTTQKAAIWVAHDKGSDCVVDVNWSSAVYIH